MLEVKMSALRYMQTMKKKKEFKNLTESDIAIISVGEEIYP